LEQNGKQPLLTAGEALKKLFRGKYPRETNPSNANRKKTVKCQTGGGGGEGSRNIGGRGVGVGTLNWYRA